MRKAWGKGGNTATAWGQGGIAPGRARHQPNHHQQTFFFFFTKIIQTKHTHAHISIYSNHPQEKDSHDFFFLKILSLIPKQLTLFKKHASVTY